MYIGPENLVRKNKIEKNRYEKFRTSLFYYLFFTLTEVFEKIALIEVDKFYVMFLIVRDWNTMRIYHLTHGSTTIFGEIICFVFFFFVIVASKVEYNII